MKGIFASAVMAALVGPSVVAAQVCENVGVRQSQVGSLFAALAALLAATFLVPFQVAGELAPRGAVVTIMLVSAAALCSVSLALRPRLLRVDRIAVVTALLLGVLTAIGNVGVAEAIARIDPSFASVILQTQVLFVAAGAWGFLGERIGARFMIGAGLALAGILVSRQLDSGAALDLVGVGWAVVAAFAFAGMHLITRPVARRIEPMTVNALRLWLAVAISLLLPGATTQIAAAPATVWGYCALAAFFGPFIGRILIMYAVRFIGAAEATLLGLTSPVFAFGVFWLVRGSVPSTAELGGGVLILIGVALPLVHARASDSRSKKTK